MFQSCSRSRLVQILVQQVQEMRVAVDAAFTESLEAEDAQADAGDENASEVESEIGRSDDEARKVPILLSHFLQRRRFLRRWRFQDYLDQDLKNGIPLSNLLRGAGPNPLYLPTFHLDVEALRPGCAWWPQRARICRFMVVS